MGIVSKIGKIRLAISITILIGTVVYGFMLYDAANKVKIDKVQVVYLQPTSIDLRTWKITFREYINSTADIDIEITKITYKVYINGTYIGEGEKTDITIPAHTNQYHQFTLEFDAIKLGIQTLLTTTKTKEVTVKGKITIPLKPFNLLTIQQITTNYTKTTYIK